jgi:dipeptidase E
MNAAVTVYGWPEEPGESIGPNHELFFPGLGLAETIVLPHYQMMKDAWLDGKRLFEDITFSHSFGRKFYAIPDGSFVLVEDGVETLYGESWLIQDGKMEKFSEYGEKNILK